MKAKRIMRSVLAMVLALSLAAGGYVLPAKAADTYNYVSLGASNTNGYGLKGYFTDDEISKIKDKSTTKGDINSVGYERSPEGSYPDLVRDSLDNTHGTVNFDQLAMSYMRAEDLRVLLDNNYSGDAYTKSKFTGGENWFSKVESGGLSALREKYQNSVKNADLVTVDLGWENFGTYLCEQLMGYMTDGQLKWSANLEDIFTTKAELAAANEVKTQIKSYVSQFLSDDSMADLTAEVLAYCMLSYVDSFDAVIEKIYTLNPDVQVVVVGAQNLLYDAKLTIGGETFDAATIFGEFVNMANYYMSARSPYCDQYLYVKAGGSDEHATMFIDELREYKVYNPDDLSDNIKDCFDYYDEDILLETTIKEAIRNDDTLSSLESLIESQGGYDIADDTLAEILRVGANINPVDISGVSGDVEGAAQKLIDYVVDEITENITDGVLGDYTVDTEGITNDSLLSAVAAVYVRVLMGHGFFNHMNPAGHNETASAITNILSNPSSEAEQSLSAEFKEMVIANQQALCAARGHEETVETVTKEATCTEAGEKTVECKACGLAEKAAIEAKGHNIEGTIEKATAKEDGIITGTCSSCGHEDTQIIPFPETVKLSYTSTTYNGKVKKPSVTVKGSDGEAIDKANYSVTYAKGRKNVGKYKVTIKFKGDYYTGTVTKTFTIKPKSTSISSLTNAKKALTVKWKKQATQTTGYQIQVATNKNFTKNKKSVTIAKTGTTSKKITGLKAKTKYYVRVRTYKTVNGTKIYSSWSAVKNKKTK